jgi:hypothetical protein
MWIIILFSTFILKIELYVKKIEPMKQKSQLKTKKSTDKALCNLEM